MRRTGEGETETRSLRADWRDVRGGRGGNEGRAFLPAGNAGLCDSAGKVYFLADQSTRRVSCQILKDKVDRNNSARRTQD